MAKEKLTIDMTPTWEFSLNILTQSVAGELNDDDESRKSSAVEIVRAGRVLDMVIEQRKELLEALELCVHLEDKEYFKTIETYAGTPAESSPEYQKKLARHEFIQAAIAKAKNE